MNNDPQVIAMGDQIHAEVTNRGNTNAMAICASEDFHPDESQTMLVQIGVQAGLHAAMKVLSERGWIRAEVQP